MPTIPEVGRLLDSLERLVGKKIVIEESISRDRDAGHDRHLSTWSYVELVVTRVTGTISGAELVVEGGGARYAMAAHAIAAVTATPDLVVTEHFEHRTERRTTIRVA